jgi:hypothetical protein
MIDSLKNMLSDSDFGLEELLPDLSGLEALLTTVLRWAVVLGPLCLLGMGLWLFLAAPKEANHKAGYRTFWGMSSVESWQFTQRLAGGVWSVLGLVLTIVMAIQSAGYSSRTGEELFTAAVVALLWQIGLVFGSCIVINLTVFVCFDRKGIFRFGKPKK